MTAAALVSRLSTQDEQLTNLLQGKGYKAWRARVEQVAGCAKPIRLVGSSAVQDSDGTVFDSTEGLMLVPCNNRREAVCEPCSARYAADTFHLVRAGLTGGKGVPESVAGHVRVFATLTPPSFGKVHNQPANPDRQASPVRVRGVPPRTRHPPRHPTGPGLLRLRGGGAVAGALHRAVAALHHRHSPPPRRRTLYPSW